jgi:hypothetical protein
MMNLDFIGFVGKAKAGSHHKRQTKTLRRQERPISGVKDPMTLLTELLLQLSAQS